MQIAVMGTGYVGLVAGACFADLGNDVTCIDVDQRKVALLNDGKIPIYEPGLDAIVRRNIREGRITFTIGGVDAIKAAQVVVIAVGTPMSHDGSADLKYVCQVAETIADHIAVEGVVVVCKSTVPIGTNQMVKEIIEGRTEVEFHIASNPEFLKEGAAVDDFMKPDRIVVGSDSAHARKVMDTLYGPLVRTGAPILHMDITSAEMTKYAANAMLATRISFMNEVANLCAAVGADVAEVRRGIGTDRRIGKHFLFPGVGYGGSCFPKDVRALLRIAKNAGFDLRILNSVEEVNASQKMVMVNQVTTWFGDVAGKHFAVWGLSFKAKTDDMREAPAITIINALLERGATVAAFDPEAHATAKAEFGDTITYARSAYDAADKADALLVVTDWAEFRQPDFVKLKTRMNADPVVFDGRNLYEPQGARDAGFVYFSIGRGRNPQQSS